jgi:hypothetical protein
VGHVAVDAIDEVDGMLEDVGLVVVEPEDEAAFDGDPPLVELGDGLTELAGPVLLVALD